MEVQPFTCTSSIYLAKLLAQQKILTTSQVFTKMERYITHSPRYPENTSFLASTCSPRIKNYLSPIAPKTDL
jgi:hypothetical protein